MSNEKRSLYPAERLRIVYQLITNPEDEGGAGVTPGHGSWKNVQSVFALHDHEYNKRWLKKWATQYTLKIEDLDEIRDRFGEKVRSSTYSQHVGSPPFLADWNRLHSTLHLHSSTLRH